MTASPDLAVHIKGLYASYRHTEDIDAKGAFFSPQCMQICRPNPSYAAQNRETIVRYLHEHADSKGNQPVKSDDDKPDEPSPTGEKGYYTIRPLREDEFEFGADEYVAPAGFATTEEVKRKATEEGWVGMRVDLWVDEGVDGEGKGKGLLVKVHYWWREEGGEWIQILHDIMYLGQRDGTEGKEGDILE